LVKSDRRLVCREPRSTAWRIALRLECRYQALRLRRTAARLDRGTPAELLGSMPFDGAVYRLGLARPRTGSAGDHGGGPVTDRWGGETYRVLWQDAAAPDYVLITSWNEWHEGSELEASVEYGSRILDDTAAFSRAFLVPQR
jgi:hypothetical protein